MLKNLKQRISAKRTGFQDIPSIGLSVTQYIAKYQQFFGEDVRSIVFHTKYRGYYVDYAPVGSKFNDLPQPRVAGNMVNG